MRAVATGLFLSLVAGAAAAQSVGNWSGPYAGVAFTAQTGSNGDTRAIIDPGLDSRLTYIVPPPGRSYAAPELRRELSPTIFAGWRQQTADWLIGVEGQLQGDGPAVRFDSGFGLPHPLDPPRACGTTPVGCLYQTSDRIAANISVQRIVSLRATVGKPIGDRVLLSGYAGPTLAWGRLEMLQTSIYGTESYNWSCTRFCTNIPTTLAETRGRTEEDTAWGVVGGLTLDLKITDNLLARADVGYSRFEALRGSTGGTYGGDSEVRAQSAGFSAGLGFSVRF
jgi:hypothetical protein